VNSVKLIQEEQNSSKQILEILNQGDYETALKRAEVFEGEKLFTIYLLMIHELTVGTSKDADFKIEACRQVINQISDIKIPITHFPCYGIYNYHIELSKIGIDDSCIWKNIHEDYGSANHIKSMLIRLLDYPKLDFEIHKKLIIFFLCEIDLIDMHILRSLKLFKIKKNEIALSELNKSTAILSKLKMTNYPHKYMRLDLEASNENYLLDFLNDMYRWYYNISELYARNGYKKNSLQNLNIALNYINKISKELIDKSNKAENDFRDNKLWQLGLYRYQKYGAIIKIYLSIDEFDQVVSIVKYKNTEEFINFLEEDYTLSINSNSGIANLYKEEINGVDRILSSEREDIYDEIYNSINQPGDNYKYVKVLLLLEKLKYLKKIENTDKTRYLIDEILELIRSFSNNTFKLSIYEKTYLIFFENKFQSEGLIVLEELYKNITQVWGVGENFNKFADIVAESLAVIYKGLYMHVNKKRAEKIFDDAFQIASKLIDSKKRQSTIHSIIATLIDSRNNSLLNSFLDLIISNGLEITYSSVSNNQNINLNILERHVYLLHTENFYDQALSFTLKYKINPFKSSEYYDRIYSLDWNTFNLHDKNAKKIHDYFSTDDLIKIYNKNTMRYEENDEVTRDGKNLGMYISNKLLSKSNFFIDFKINEVFSFSKIVPNRRYKEIKHNLLWNLGYTFQDKYIYHELARLKSTEESVSLHKHFKFEKTISSLGINTNNVFEMSEIYRDTLIDTYINKIKLFMDKKNKISLNKVCAELFSFLKRNDLGKGRDKMGNYDFNATAYLKLSIFFMDCNLKEYSLRCIENCIEVYDLNISNRPSQDDIYDAYFKINKKFLSKSGYIETIKNIFNKYVNNEIFDCVDSYHHVIKLFYLLDEIGETKTIREYSKVFLDIEKKSEYNIEEDRENAFSSFAEFSLITGRFEEGESMYNSLSEEFKKSISGNTLDILSLKIEYLIKNNKLKELGFYYMNKETFIKETFNNNNKNLWTRETSIHVGNLLKNCKLLLKYNHVSLCKRYLTDAREICIEFYRFSLTNNGESIEYHSSKCLDNLITIFDNFNSIKEEILAKDTLKFIVNQYQGNSNSLKFFNKVKIKHELLISLLKSFDIEKIKYLDSFILEIIKMNDKKTLNRNLVDYRAIYLETFQIENKWYQLLYNNLNYECFAESLIHYVKVKVFFSNENKQDLSGIDNVIDYSNWKKIKNRIDKNQHLQ